MPLHGAIEAFSDRVDYDPTWQSSDSGLFKLCDFSGQVIFRRVFLRIAVHQRAMIVFASVDGHFSAAMLSPIRRRYFVAEQRLQRVLAKEHGSERLHADGVVD